MPSQSELSNNQWSIACNGVIEFLLKQNYSPGSIYRFSGFYKKLLKFLRSKNNLHVPVSLKHTDAFLRFCGLADSKFPQNPSEKQCRSMCAIRFLLTYHQTGTIEQYGSRVSFSLSHAYTLILKEYQHYFLEIKESVTKRRFYEVTNNIRDFLAFLCESGIKRIDKIRFEHVHAYFQKFHDRKPDTIARKARFLKFFFNYLVSRKRVPSKILDFIPRIRHTKSFRLSTRWSQKSIQKLLSVIDRKTSIGKRDYAICLLISRLGLRVGDVRLLQIENINWRKSVICLRQQKTKQPLELPFCEEVGQALIDYLKKGRPVSPLRHVFLCHRAPFRSFLSSASFNSLITKYQKKANLVFPQGSLHGFHSLRHSLATRLHEENTPFPIIAALLGHRSFDSTRIYTRTNIEMLRSVALEWKEI
jgi:site-specific recombinase XerD